MVKRAIEGWHWRDAFLVGDEKPIEDFVEPPVDASRLGFERLEFLWGAMAGYRRDAVGSFLYLDREFLRTDLWRLSAGIRLT